MTDEQKTRHSVYFPDRNIPPDGGRLQLETNSTPTSMSDQLTLSFDEPQESRGKRLQPNRPSSRPGWITGKDEKRRLRKKLLNVRYDMIKRCTNSNYHNYPYYGGRGITVCQEWLEDRDAFVQFALENGWKEGLQIDRIDNDENYSPENCRFVTRSENNRNKRNSLTVEIDGEKRLLVELLEADGYEGPEYSTVKGRIKLGWTPEKALSMPLQEQKVTVTAWGESRTLSEWQKDSRYRKTANTTFWNRINNLGWSPEEALSTPSRQSPLRLTSIPAAMS